MIKILLLLGLTISNYCFSQTFSTEKNDIYNFDNKSNNTSAQLFEKTILTGNVAKNRMQAQQKTKAYNMSSHNKLTNDSDSIYIIPIVFHVIYHDSVDNISEAQILDGLEELNERFRKRNADTIDIIAPFIAIAADAKIEFHLATIDPDGNPTNGITRTYTDSLAFDFLWDAYYDSTGGKHTWQTDMYLNIHVVKEFAGIIGGGRGSGPSDIFPERQGIIITNNMVGSFGTAYGSTTFTHEAGHFFNLYHLWAYLGTPGDTANCSKDDEVDDTPNCFGSSYYYGNPSGLWAESCGTLDNVQNYMDYSPSNIRNMFTIGQVDRMHEALNSSVGARNNLYTIENLIATGIINTNSIAVNHSREFSIYPNPAKEIINILSRKESIKTIQIFNISGKEVLNYSNINDYSIEIYINHLKTGVYIVKINQSINQKLIVL